VRVRPCDSAEQWLGFWIGLAGNDKNVLSANLQGDEWQIQFKEDYSMPKNVKRLARQRAPVNPNGEHDVTFSFFEGTARIVDGPLILEAKGIEFTPHQVSIGTIRKCLVTDWLSQ
jgi:hypothetical protein